MTLCEKTNIIRHTRTWKLSFSVALSYKFPKEERKNKLEMFYVDINADVDNQQSASGTVASHNGNSGVKTARTAMSASKASPKSSPSMKKRHQPIKDDDDDEITDSLFPRCKSSKCIVNT